MNIQFDSIFFLDKSSMNIGVKLSFQHTVYISFMYIALVGLLGYMAVLFFFFFLATFIQFSLMNILNHFLTNNVFLLQS